MKHSRIVWQLFVIALLTIIFSFPFISASSKSTPSPDHRAASAAALLSRAQGYAGAGQTPPGRTGLRTPRFSRKPSVTPRKPAAGHDSAVLFFDDMESGVNGWTVETFAETLWHRTIDDAVSGDHSWWAGSEPSGTYNTGGEIDQSLISPEIVIPAGSESPSLMFSEYYVTEERWDRCTVEVTVDGGTSWTPLNGTGASGYSYRWLLSQYDLSAWTGDTIRIRFHFVTTDALFNDFAGWFIDNVLVCSGTGEISGLAYADRDSNHQFNAGDCPLENRQITLEGNSIVAELFTDEAGSYSATLPYGTYSASIDIGLSWTAIDPPEGTRSVTISTETPSMSEANFGLWRRLALVSGSIFSDLNHNGTRDGGDTLVPDQAVDLYASGIHIEYEDYYHFTDASGRFTFAVHDTGQFTLQQSPEDWAIQTSPADGAPIVFHVQSLDSTYSGFEFGNYYTADPSGSGTSSISGAVYSDTNRNDARDIHEIGIAGVAVTIQGPDNGSAVTDTLGRFEFHGLRGGSYIVTARSSPGWWAGDEGTSEAGVTVFPDSQAVGVELGLHTIAASVISGTVISDLNRNGARDPGEPGIPGFTISLTGVNAYGNHVITSAVSCTGGKYEFDSIWPGSYVLEELKQARWVQTLPAGFRNKAVYIDPDSISVGNDFGNHFDSTFNSVYRSFIQESIAYAFDAKGVKWGPTKGYYTGANFSATVINQTGMGAQQLALTFKYAILDTLICSRVCAQGFDESRRIATLTFLSDLPAGDTVVVSGRSYSPGKATFGYSSPPQWIVSGHAVPGSGSVRVTGKRYMTPNAADMLMAINGPVQVGTGRTHVVLMKKYGDVGKSLFDPGTRSVHTGAPRCLDLFTNGKSIKKTAGYLRLRDQNNRLFAEATALKIGILASDAAITPRGFGDLIYDEGGASPFNGRSVRQIAAKLDTFMSSYKDSRPPVACSMPSGFESSTPGEFWRVIRRIDSAFCGPLEALSYTPKPIAMFLGGMRSINDIDFVKIDSALWSKTGVYAGYQAQEETKPESFSLLQNYPNPFNPTTTIGFVLDEESLVSLTVYDLLGRRVDEVLHDEPFEPGLQSVQYDGLQLASGVYYYRISVRSSADRSGAAGVRSETRKMILLR